MGDRIPVPPPPPQSSNSPRSGYLLLDPETFGLLLESSCVRNLRVYGGALGGSIFHTATGRDHSQAVATREP